MAQQEIPAASFGVVGGSGTLSSDFPARLPDEDREMLADNLIFDTPYGKSQLFACSRSARCACSRAACTAGARA